MLSTKLNIPPTHPQTVLRSRLIERLQDGLKYSFILVSAPAGFGKTTLLSEWAHREKAKIRIAWLSIDQGDNDPTRFWNYFIAALRTLQPDCGETALNLLHTDERFSSKVPIESVLNALINDIAGIPGEFVVALDDFHLIESKPIHDGITYLIEHMPAQMHLAMATRADPPLPLARFRAGRTMLEIGADDLRFSMDDVVSLLKELKAPEISEKDIAALNERAEGWAAGLIMAILSLKGRKDIPGFIADFTGSQRYVMDYLVEEVLQKQTPEATDFLLKTAVLERLTGPLCDAVTGYQDSRAILVNLERDHLFITPLDDTRQWYRYEHLFRDILRHRLEAEYGEGIVRGLFQKASKWYEENGYEDEAIDHALAAQDWETAARLLENAAPRKEQSGEWTIAIGWMRVIPTEVLLTHPDVYYEFGKLLQGTGQTKAAKAVLSDLEPIARQKQRLQGKMAALRMYIATAQEDKGRAIEYGREALSLLPEEEARERGFVLCILGILLSGRGNFTEAEQLLKKAFKTGRQAGANNITIGMSTTYLAMILHLKGRLHEAFQLCQEAVNVIGQSPAATNVIGYLGIIYREWNDLKASLSHLEQADNISHYLNASARDWVTNHLAQTKLALGDIEGALETLTRIDRTEQDPENRSAWSQKTLSVYTEIALKQGDLKKAIEWGSQLSESPADIMATFGARMHVLLARGKKSEVAEYLQAIEKTMPPDLVGALIPLRIIQALATDSEEEALEFLTEALNLGEPEGYVRSFVDEGRPLLPILEKTLSRGVMPEYTRKLITIIEAEERQWRLREKGKEALSPYQSILSEREIEVLRLMAEGLSNQQIADRLIISLSTAKNHVHNILEKLNVQGRTQSVAQARELGLI